MGGSEWKILRASLLLFLLQIMTNIGAGEGATVEIALKSKCNFGGSPVWDGSMLRLHFVDRRERRVLSYDPHKELCTEVDINRDVSSVVPYICKRVLVPSSDRIIQVDLAGQGEQVPLHIAWLPITDEFCDSIEIQQGERAMTNRAGFRFADAQCDPRGRLWVGYHRFESEDGEDAEKQNSPGEDRGDGAVFCMAAPSEWEHEEDPDGVLHQYGPNPTLRPRLRGPSVPGAMAWSVAAGAQECDAVFKLDPAGMGIDQYKFDVATGDIDASSRRRVAQIPTDCGYPRGLAVDSTGKLWVAMDGGGCVVQFDPDAGEQLQRVPLPAAHPTGCAFGGEQLQHLYVTTRRAETAADADADESGSHVDGSLLRVTIPSVSGLHPAWHFSDPVPKKPDNNAAPKTKPQAQGKPAASKSRRPKKPPQEPKAKTEVGGVAAEPEVTM